MARDRDTNGRRVVTAGHCTFLFSSANWNAQNEAGSWKSIGAGAGTWFAGGAGDGGVIANSGLSWQRPAPIGMVLWRPVASIALDYQYPIRGDASGVVGRFVCRTGMTTGSECGEISLLNADNTGELNGVNYTVSGLTEVDMCAAAAGDSGGPYFKNKKAYGVQSGTQKFGTTSCFEVFQPIRVLKYVFDLDLVLAP
ncbi:MAG: trypsin-like serine protease [Bryobacterales bacterium]|nr:trypsin-like serine protease [Bryobacterales bacterium]